MNISTYYPKDFFSTNQLYSYNTSNVSTSNTNGLTEIGDAATLELTATEQLEMEAYQPYSLQSIKNTYAMATTSSVPSYEIYNTWFQELGSLADLRLADSYQAIITQRGTTEGITQKFMEELSSSQLTWLEEQKNKLYEQLNDNSPISDMEWTFYEIKASALLERMDVDLWSAIDINARTGEEQKISFTGTVNKFLDSETILSEKISLYLGDFQQEIDNRTWIITEKEIEQFGNNFNDWANDLKESLLQNINSPDSPTNTLDYLLSEMENNFDIIMPGLWESLLNSIHMKNGAIGDENRRRQQAAEAEQFNRLRIDYKTGSDSNEIRITTSTPSSSNYSSKFVIVDPDGRSKNLYVSFKNEKLKSAFDKKIKEAGLEGKKISSKKFDEILKELKKSLKDISDVDMDALLRKMSKGEKDLDFEHGMSRFILYLKRAVNG